MGNRIIQSFQPLASYVYFQEFHRYLFFPRSPSFSVSPLNFIPDYLEFKTNLKVKEDIFTLLITLLKTDKETYFITWGFKLVLFIHFSIILFSGCNTLSSGNPLPTECNVCRVAKDKNTGSCLPECPPEKFLTADKLCVDLSCK